MCYIIVRRSDAVGCTALQMKAGKELVDLKKEIYRRVGHYNIELITISKPSAYEEYAPYNIVETVEGFKQIAYRLACQSNKECG